MDTANTSHVKSISLGDNGVRWSNRSGVSSKPHKKIQHCFIEPETLPSFLSTGWSQEQIRAGFTIEPKQKLTAMW